MAIYQGTWQDEAGVAFDPSCFSLHETKPVSTGQHAVFGYPDPDCTGTYNYTGIHNGMPYFTRIDNAFVLFWYQDEDRWCIALDLTEPPINYWQSSLSLSYWFVPNGAFAGYAHPFPFPLPDFYVAGILTPDATGTYAPSGIFNTLPYWEREDSAFYIYFSSTANMWILGPALEDWPTDGWVAANFCQSYYWAFGDYEGLAWNFYIDHPSLTVHQTTDPDCSGTYVYAGAYEGYPYWTRQDFAYSLWSDPETNNWYISVAPGNTIAGVWTSALGLDTTYDPTAPYTGSPHVDRLLISTSTPWGVARERIFGRRGGSGSPPGLYHGSPAQEACRLHFCNRMHAYTAFPYMNDVTFWEHAGQDHAWLVRDGSEKKLHGQAMYPRSVMPPAYGNENFPDEPDLDAEPPPVDYAVAKWLFVIARLQCAIHYTEQYHGGEFSGLSVFQIDPRAVYDHWWHKHTHIVRTISPLDIHGLTLWHFFVPLWYPYIDTDHLAVFFRLWYKNAFIQFGPIFAQHWPP